MDENKLAYIIFIASIILVLGIFIILPKEQMTTTILQPIKIIMKVAP